ncbi:MAG: hypothetical protein P4L33_15040 [Capsulimonadaceae bacterium]|nr:hypothetical protein [Capsulimonadaceae bacterium]
MKQSSQRAIQVAVILMAALIAYRIAFPILPPDQQQIQQQIQYAAAQMQERSVGGALRVLSDHYIDDNGFTGDALKLMLMRATRDATSIAVSVRSTQIDVRGESATSRSFVGVTVDRPSGNWSRASQEIVLTWKKERVNHLLIIPAKEWRVVSASYGSVDF